MIFKNSPGNVMRLFPIHFCLKICYHSIRHYIEFIYLFDQPFFSPVNDRFPEIPTASAFKKTINIMHGKHNSFDG